MSSITILRLLSICFLIRSVLRLLEKDSTTALSQQLPRQVIRGQIVCALDINLTGRSGALQKVCHSYRLRIIYLPKVR